MAVEQLLTVVLLENFINQGAVLIGENNVFDAANRFFDCQQRHPSLLIAGNLLDQREQRFAGDAGAAIKNLLQIIGQQVMALFPLFPNDLL